MRIIIGAVTVFLTFVGTIMPARLAAQQAQQHLSHAQLRRLVANASNTADYQKLAAYFHYQEQIYRAKADAEMDDYAHCVRNVTMSPKFPTRADQAARLYQYYSTKADQQARLAAHYDELLTKNGVKPAGVAQIVSVTDLEHQPQKAETASGLLQTTQAGPESNSPRAKR